MQVDDNTLKRAMFGVMQREPGAADTGLPYLQIRKLWTRTGLRESDLRDAVRVLAEQHCIRLEDVEGTIAVRLTESGRREYGRQTLRLDQLSEEVRQRVALLQARLRSRGGGEQRRRRVNDRPASMP